MKEDEIKINIIFFRKIYNKTYMFKNCYTLIKFSIINKDDKLEFPEILNLPEEEENLFDIYDDEIISEKPLTKELMNYESFPYIYSEISQKTLQNYSSFSTIKKYHDDLKAFVKNESEYNLAGIFYNCLSLKSLPDVSKWNINNVININLMFYNCSSLKS